MFRFACLRGILRGVPIHIYIYVYIISIYIHIYEDETSIALEARPGGNMKASWPKGPMRARPIRAKGGPLKAQPIRAQGSP